MKIFKIAQTNEAPKINALDGRSNDSARNYVRVAVKKALIGRTFFNDNYWEGPQLVWDGLTKANIEWQLTGSRYGMNKDHQEQAMANPELNSKMANDFKEWYVEISFVNKNSRPTVLKATLIASFCGTVADPTSRYDLVFLV